MRLLSLKTFYLVGVLGLITSGAHAQELLPPDSDVDTSSLDDSNSNTVSPDAFVNDPTLPFNGTLDEAYQNEDKLFGSDNEETAEPPVTAPNMILKFEFVSHLQFLNPGDPSPYIDIQYTNTMEVPLVLSHVKQNIETTINIDSQNWGALAQNEFFECRLSIPSQQYAASISVKLNTKAPETEGDEESSEAILRVNFNEPFLEPWFSFCSDTSGHVLNTQGAPEEYNMQIVKMIEPNLSSLVISDFKTDAVNKIDLATPQKIVDDVQLNNTLFLSGEGSITLSPL